MEKEKISMGQLFSLIFLFEMGTALVIPVGFVSQKDVWLSVILASFGGMILFLLYHYLSLQYPGLPLSGYAQKILGKPIGWIVSFLYILFFIYNGSRDLREAGDLLTTSFYHKTPLLVIVALLILVIIYALSMGIEVLARTAELYFLIIIVFSFFWKYPRNIIRPSKNRKFLTLFRRRVETRTKERLSEHSHVSFWRNDLFYDDFTQC